MGNKILLIPTLIADVNKMAASGLDLRGSFIILADMAEMNQLHSPYWRWSIIPAIQYIG